ncbi:MAG: transposase [Acidobacteriia bacterium]|nr:transposase [Terriglobia bacterium]
MITRALVGLFGTPGTGRPAALEVASGQVKAGHFQRRRRRDFLAFLNKVVAAYPQRELHVIVDNLKIHKPKRDRWLRQHPQVQLHFTPTHASSLNQVEVWFSLLARQALRGASFTSCATTTGGHRCACCRLQPAGRPL